MHLHPTRPALPAAVVLAAALAVPLLPASPAGAAVTTSVSGTTLTVTATGDEAVNLRCLGSGQVGINSTIVVPNVACGALTAVTIDGDGGNQRVDLHESTGGAHQFTALADCTGDLGAGNDSWYECEGRDVVDLGTGNDFLTVRSTGTTNGGLDLGESAGDVDYLQVIGTNGPETIKGLSPNANALVQVIDGAGTRLFAVLGVEALAIEGFGGDDVLDASGVTVASGIGDDVELYGDDGDDTLKTGPKGGGMHGGTGANTFTGGAGPDNVDTQSSTDTINPGAGLDYVTDSGSLHFGGRTYVGPFDDNWIATLAGGDSVARARPTATAGAYRFTASLTRGGQQVLPVGGAFLSARSGTTGVDTRGLGDFVAAQGGHLVYSGDTFDDDVFDLTVPAGNTWTTSGSASEQQTITLSNLPAVYVGNVGTVSIHGPWTDADAGFAHRVTRDLQFRIPTTAQRNAIRARLVAGTSRATIVAELMGTDLYRGLDVDRSYVDFLGRGSDAAGRSYWVGRIASGTSLRALRSLLLGSSEFFTGAGGTNAKYVAAAYARVLHRPPDAAGLAYWVGRLDAGGSRTTVADTFLNTSEARRAIVTDQFLRFLDRPPTTASADTWTATLGSSPTGEQDLIAALASGAEYFART